jgi:hypothetical protein
MPNLTVKLTDAQMKRATDALGGNQAKVEAWLEETLASVVEGVERQAKVEEVNVPSFKGRG